MFYLLRIAVHKRRVRHTTYLGSELGQLAERDRELQRTVPGPAWPGQAHPGVSCLVRSTSWLPTHVPQLGRSLLSFLPDQRHPWSLIPTGARYGVVFTSQYFRRRRLASAIAECNHMHHQRNTPAFQHCWHLVAWCIVGFHTQRNAQNSLAVKFKMADVAQSGHWDILSILDM